MAEERKYWRTFIHNGVYLPPTPEYRGLSIIVAGTRVQLGPEAEEMALAWAKVMKTKLAEDPVFQSNFLKDFRKRLPAEYRSASLAQMDFTEVYRAYIRDKISRKLNVRLKKRRIRERKALKKKYGYVIVDGRRVEVANWAVEPPGLFMGRGDHPLRGRWKPRVRQRDIVLNLSRNSPVPPGKWGGIVHDNSAMWVARWKDRLTHRIKYVWLHEGSKIRQTKDREKYDKAARLSSKIERVRKYILKGLHARDPETRKIATACYLIDKLGMRVGDEKESDEADTVGATTLRVEHVTITGDAVEFRFLGKDSVEWHKSIRLSEADTQFIMNLQRLIHGKKPDDQVFDTVSSASVNRFLGKVFPGLTAKVFRTYHATRVVHQFLSRYEKRARRSNRRMKLYYARLANLEAARFCNHKKTIPRGYKSSLRKRSARLNLLLQTVPRTKKQERRIRQESEKLRLELDLARRTRDYNLGTSLKNYIDPRVYKAWADRVNMDWREIYTNSLQRKFGWVARAKWKWDGEAPKRGRSERRLTQAAPGPDGLPAPNPADGRTPPLRKD